MIKIAATPNSNMNRNATSIKVVVDSRLVLDPKLFNISSRAIIRGFCEMTE